MPTAKPRNAVKGADPKTLGRAFKAALQTHIDRSTGRPRRSSETAPHPLPLASEDELPVLEMVRHFIGIVGPKAFGAALRAAHEATTPDWAAEAFCKWLRQGDVFPKLKGHGDMLLYHLVQQENSGAFWDVFNAVVFPPKGTSYALPVSPLGDPTQS